MGLFPPLNIALLPGVDSARADPSTDEDCDIPAVESRVTTFAVAVLMEVTPIGDNL